ncbi:MAG: hypothetical protein LC722_05680 [Actinobacteria bacterium]|nr:hypothetical protein [Actinomycetota bacterium]
MDYEQAVARGRTLLTRSETDQWALAELTYQVLQVDKRTTRQWAASLGVSKTHVTCLRDVHDKFVLGHWSDQRTNLTFNECYRLVLIPEDEIDELLARARKRHRSVTTVQRDPKPRDPIQDARKLLRNDRHARKVLSDKRAREAIERELERRRQRAEAAKPTPTNAERFTALRDGFYAFLGDLIDQRLPRPERRALSEISGEVANANDWVQAYLDSGDRSFEDVLDAILAGAEPEEVGVGRPVKPRRRGDPAIDGGPEEATSDPVQGGTDVAAADGEGKRRRGPSRRFEPDPGARGRRRAS